MDRSKRFTLFAFPGRPVHSDTVLGFSGSILARQQLRAKTKSLTFPPLSIARYSFIQLSRLRRQWREGKCPIFQTVAKGDSNPGSLDCESGILTPSYRAPYTYYSQFLTLSFLSLCLALTCSSLFVPQILLQNIKHKQLQYRFLYHINLEMCVPKLCTKYFL